MAMAPPSMFMRSRSMESSRTQASACTANASLSSITSTSAIFSPARASAFSDETTGP